MIDTDVLRRKTLDLAIQGKLTEQLPIEGNAEELYQQIQAEKAKLIKEKKIKKNKTLPEITADEIPFGVPANWKWVYLGEIFSHNTGKALNSSNKEGNLLEYITTSNMYWDHFEVDNLKKMYFRDDEIEKCTVKKGDLLICEGGDIGRSAIWNFPYEMRIQNHIHKLRPYLPSLSPVFYYYVMMLYKLSNLINGQGIGLQGFSSNRVHTLLVPLPPSSEQARIVKKIDDIFEILNKIDALQNRYSFNKEALKSKLIDLAIQGKLTEQLPEDGTAEELYQAIQEEKAQLIKDKKIKKEKPLPEITAEEIPFEIPENWKWVRIGNIFQLHAGKNVKANCISDRADEEHQYLCYGGNGIRGYVADYNCDGEYPLIGRQGALCGNVHLAEGKFYATEHAVVTDTFANTDVKWAENFLKALCLNQYATATAQPGLAVNKIEQVLIPLPPLSEQKRIVAKIDEVLSALDKRDRL